MNSLKTCGFWGLPSGCNFILFWFIYYIYTDASLALLIVYYDYHSYYLYLFIQIVIYIYNYIVILIFYSIYFYLFITSMISREVTASHITSVTYYMSHITGGDSVSICLFCQSYMDMCCLLKLSGSGPARCFQRSRRSVVESGFGAYRPRFGFQRLLPAIPTVHPSRDS